MATTRAFTIDDVVPIFNKRYSIGRAEAVRVNDLKNLWAKITKDIFETYEKDLIDVEDLSDFRSKLRKAVRKIKDSKESNQKTRIGLQLELELKPWYYREKRNA